jgi:hypothetical protein
VSALTIKEVVMLYAIVRFPGSLKNYTYLATKETRLGLCYLKSGFAVVVKVESMATPKFEVVPFEGVYVFPLVVDWYEKQILEKLTAKDYKALSELALQYHHLLGADANKFLGIAPQALKWYLDEIFDVLM